MLRSVFLAAPAALLSLAGGCAPAAEDTATAEASFDSAGPAETRALEEAAAMLDERPDNSAAGAETADTAAP